MAIVFLALNGQGLGHLVRVNVVCRALAAVGERPIVFSQGIFPLDDRSPFPGKHVPSLWKAEPAVRRRVGAEIAALAEISQPAVLVEDTHPNPVELPPGVRRVLLVRPPAFEYLQRLEEAYGSVYSAFVVCDAPGSPTWPYSDAETEAMRRWRRWSVVGPIYRQAEPSDVAEVRERYRLRVGQRLCVFSMGGGGQHPPYQDARRFVTLAGQVAERLVAASPVPRLVLVRGPYFPFDAEIPHGFEVVDQEPRMPALFAVADGAVIRVGFNSTWECVAAGTPFLPFVGVTFGEPTDARLTRLRSLSLLPGDLDTFWNDHCWRESFRRSCASVIARWSGTPDAAELQRLILDSGAANRSAALLLGIESRSEGVRASRPPDAPAPHRRRRLVIRIDDAVALEPALRWLLELLAQRRLRASVEVVPYLLDFEEPLLDQFDPTGELFEVSQHGYAHIPHQGRDGRPFEFSLHSPGPDADEQRAITWGIDRVRWAFPHRFSGGFSPPYDGLPRWLPGFWHERGGRFVSSGAIHRVGPTPIPVIRAGTDIWNWTHRQARSAREVLRAIERQARQDGHGGLIVHPHRLRSAAERRGFGALLGLLREEGFETASLREIATRRSRAWRARLAKLRWRWSGERAAPHGP